MIDFTTTSGKAIESATIHAKGTLRLRLRDVGDAKFRAKTAKDQMKLILLESSSGAILSANLVGLFEGAKGIWSVDLVAKGIGSAALTAKVEGADVAKLMVTVVARLDLPASTSEVGMLARLFLAESRLPGSVGYNPQQARLNMEYMKLVLHNRLKFPKWFGAPGATTLRDIVTAPKSIEGFGRYPTLSPSQALRIENLIKLANDDNHPKQAEFATILQTAIEVAQGKPITDPSPIGLYGWRTAGSGSPGPNFVAFSTPLSGNQFYTLKEALK